MTTVTSIRRGAIGLLLVCGTLCTLPCHAGDPFNGRTIYQQHCAGCHGASGESDMLGVPNFKRGEGLFNPDASLLQTLRDGRNMQPAFRGLLTDDELLDAIAYIRTLY